MARWEYLAIKVYEFGSEEAEEKRPNEYWVSDYGLLPLLKKLGEHGWEAVCQVGRDVIMKRPGQSSSSDTAVVDVDARERAKAGR